MSLKLTITYEPGGDKSRAQVIEEVRIGNVSELAPLSTYHVEPLLHSTTQFGVAIVEHERAEGVWPLIAKVADRIATIKRGWAEAEAGRNDGGR